ncbi:MAG: hypothetical protein JW774_00345 [Candidatus Aureabacteria bacterium]|nr:hypothetical protein [Candidatus Auribacterota bacterium]
MNIAMKYLDREEYDRDWEPKYQSLEKKYFKEEGTPIGDSAEYDSELERLNYLYAKAVSQRIHQKMREALTDCQSSLEKNDYSGFEKKWETVNSIWKDFNTSFHYKMSARGILEKD